MTREYRQARRPVSLAPLTWDLSSHHDVRPHTACPGRGFGVLAKMVKAGERCMVRSGIHVAGAYPIGIDAIKWTDPLRIRFANGSRDARAECFTSSEARESMPGGLSCSWQRSCRYDCQAGYGRTIVMATRLSDPVRGTVEARQDPPVRKTEENAS